MLDHEGHSKTNTAPEGAPDSGALAVVPRDLRSAAPAGDAAPAPSLPVRREPTVDALVPDDRDSERVAFAMWREGRTDDAIAFLEREILLEKDRVWKRDAFTGRREPHFGKPEPEIIVTPPPATEALPKRRRRRGASTAPVSEPTFSDASAPVIELSAESVASAPIMVPPRARMGSGPAIVAAIGLVIVGFAAAANIWDNRRAATAERAAPVIAVPLAKDDAVAPAATASITPAAVKPTAEPAAAEPASAEPAPAQPAALEVPAPSAPLDLPASGATEDEAAVVDPDEIVTEPEEEAVALVEPGDDSFSPPDELDEAALGALDGSALDEEALNAPARLPRQRPEPPAGVTYAPQTAAVSPAPQSPPRYVPPPAPIPPGPFATQEPYRSDTPPRAFYGADGVPQRETLSPAEYEALLARRAVAEDYVARRRALAEDSVPSERRVILRLLRR
jgi:hypothetical protein